MKKSVLFSLACLFFVVSCKDDEPTSSSSYPTDGLTLSTTSDALLMINYTQGNPQAALYQLQAMVSERKFGNELNHVTLVNQMGFMYSAAADSILSKFMAAGAPSFLLNDVSGDIAMIDDEIESELLDKPFVSVAHKATANDTAWLVDVKVQMQDDSTTNGVFVESYLLADIQAKVFDSLGVVDLRMAAQAPLIVNDNEKSTWGAAWPQDSAVQYVQPGDNYFHSNVLLENFSKLSIWGTNLGIYNPFGIEYQRNDIVGTRFTPIRHYFLKPKARDISFDFDFKPKFLTVVWFYDELTDQYTYINSYMSTL